MRKLLCCLLIAVMVFSMTGCQNKGPKPTDTAPTTNLMEDPTGYKVTNPMKYPDYTLDDQNYTIMDLRLTAVQAARDILSINWSIAEGISYNKTGPVSNKLFMHAADTTYAGLLYSNASTGLFQFMEYYDQETGRLLFPGSANQLKETLGASCADAMIWGLNTVCTSLTGSYYPSTMVIKNGYYPLGGITYDESLSNFTFNPTDKIIEANGASVVIQAYTMVQPADMLVSTPDNHGMMAIAAPHVVTNADGSIDMAKSYIKIQDQRGGQGQGFYEQEINGEVIQFSGRTEYNFTFEKLLEKGYIPVTTAEFMGTKAYERAMVEVDSNPTTFEQLLQATIHSNYPPAVINATLIYPDGTTYLIEKKLFSGAGDEGVPREFSLSDMFVLAKGEFLESLKDECDYTLVIEVVAANGERLTPVKITI